MTATLIIFIAFHFGAGSSSQAVNFENIQLCELARKNILAEAEKRDPEDDFGRKRIVAKCVITDTKGIK